MPINPTIEDYESISTDLTEINDLIVSLASKLDTTVGAHYGNILRNALKYMVRYQKSSRDKYDHNAHLQLQELSQNISWCKDRDCKLTA